MYEMPLDELLQKLEARGIDTSKITLIEDNSEENEDYVLAPLVKWLRHRLFTAVTWVRFPYGVLSETTGRQPAL